MKDLVKIKRIDFEHYILHKSVRKKVLLRCTLTHLHLPPLLLLLLQQLTQNQVPYLCQLA
jgi:hypothetical protein